MRWLTQQKGRAMNADQLAEFRARAASLVGKLESPELKVAQYPIVESPSAAPTISARELFSDTAGPILWQVMTDRRVVSAVESKDVAALRDALLGYVSDWSREMREVREQLQKARMGCDNDGVMEALRRFDSLSVLSRWPANPEDARSLRIKGAARPKVFANYYDGLALPDHVRSGLEKPTVWVVETERVLTILKYAGVESSGAAVRGLTGSAVVKLSTRDDLVKILTNPAHGLAPWYRWTVLDLMSFESPLEGDLRTDDLAFHGVDGTGTLEFEPYAFSQYEWTLKGAESWLKDVAAHAEEFVEAGVKSFHGPCKLTRKEPGDGRDPYLVVESLGSDLEKLIKRWS